MKKKLLSTVLKSTLFLLILTMAAGMLQSCSSAYDTAYDTQRREMKLGKKETVGSMGSIIGAQRAKKPRKEESKDY